MPKEIQNPDFARELVEALDLTGRVRLLLDDVVVPVVLSDDLSRTPFQRTEPCFRRREQAAAGAGVFSGLSAIPGTSVILEINELVIHNATGAAQTYQLRENAPNQLGTFTTVNESPFNALNRITIGPGTLRDLSSRLRELTTVGLNGTILRDFELPAASTEVWTFREPIFLHGPNPAGQAGLTLFNVTANQPVRASFFGREHLAPRVFG